VLRPRPRQQPAETNSEFQLFNPSYRSGLDLALTQPLLRDFKIDSQRLQLRIAKRNKDISDIQFRQTVVNTIASVKQQYYDLIYAIDNLEAQRKSLALASKLLDENQIKVRVGTMAPLDVVAAESEVAGREEAVIVAEAALLDAEDQLRALIFKDNAARTGPTASCPTDRPVGRSLARRRDRRGDERAREADGRGGGAEEPGELVRPAEVRAQPEAAGGRPAGGLRHLGPVGHAGARRQRRPDRVSRQRRASVDSLAPSSASTSPPGRRLPGHVPALQPRGLGRARPAHGSPASRPR
jgi:hypothetical protein